MYLITKIIIICTVKKKRLYPFFTYSQSVGNSQIPTWHGLVLKYL